MKASEFLLERPIQDPVSRQAAGSRDIRPGEKKALVIKAIEQMRTDNEFIDQAYRLLVGPTMDARLKDIIEQHKDIDIGIEELEYLLDWIPRLGTTEEVAEFATKWNTEGNSFIDIGNLIPAGGMSERARLETIITPGIPLKLFAKLVRAGMFSKGDAGPAEIALAIMSQQINLPHGGEGGDIIIGDAKIEVKSGGKGQGGGGGVIWGKRRPHQELITEYMDNRGLTLYKAKSISVRDAGTKNWGEDWDEEDYRGFIETVSKAWFDGKIYKNIVNSFGTSNFQKAWLDTVFKYYASKSYGNHAGVLIIGKTEYQYITNSTQPTYKKIGYLYYPGSTQPREVAPQVILN